MNHDPLCRFSKKRAADDEYDDCEYCDLITKVRADERSMCAGAGQNHNENVMELTEDA